MITVEKALTLLGADKRFYTWSHEGIATHTFRDFLRLEISPDLSNLKKERMYNLCNEKWGIPLDSVFLNVHEVVKEFIDAEPLSDDEIDGGTNG